MTKLSTGRLAVSMLLAVLALTTAGCWNPFAPDPGKPKPIQPAEFRDRTSPENVLHNLRTAYVWKNADEYLDCLSEDFIFYPTDEDVQNPDLEIPPEWYKPNERSMHENMFAQGSNVESISLTLTEMSTDYIEGIPDDPTDDIYIYTESVDLRVNLYGGLTYLANAPSQYWFRVDQDQQGENGEIWWEIYLWYDDPVLGRDGSSGDPDVEYMSLSEIKSLYAK
jgi:hypothetical protein